MNKSILAVAVMSAIALSGCGSDSSDNSSGVSKAARIDGTAASVEQSSQTVIAPRAMRNTDDGKPSWFVHQSAKKDKYLGFWGSSQIDDESDDLEFNDILGDINSGGDGTFEFTIQGDAYLDVNSVDYWTRFQNIESGKVPVSSYEYPLLADIRVHTNDIGEPDHEENGLAYYEIPLTQDAVAAVTWQVKRGYEDFVDLDEVILSLSCSDPEGLTRAPVVFSGQTGSTSWPWDNSKDVNTDAPVNNVDMKQGYTYLHVDQFWNSDDFRDVPEIESAKCKLTANFSANGVEGETTFNQTLERGGWLHFEFTYGDGEGVLIDKAVGYFKEVGWGDMAHGGDIDVSPTVPPVELCRKKAKELGFEEDDIVNLFKDYIGIESIHCDLDATDKLNIEYKIEGYEYETERVKVAGAESYFLSLSLQDKLSKDDDFLSSTLYVEVKEGYSYLGLSQNTDTTLKVFDSNDKFLYWITDGDIIITAPSGESIVSKTSIFGFSDVLMSSGMDPTYISREGCFGCDIPINASHSILTELQGGGGNLREPLNYWHGTPYLTPLSMIAKVANKFK